MPLTTNYQKLKSLTLNSKNLSDTQLAKIKQIIKSVVDNKKDEYWKNYIDYKKLLYCWSNTVHLLKHLFNLRIINFNIYLVIKGT